MREEVETLLFSYLNGLVSKYLFVYLRQGDGFFKANRLHRLVIDSYEKHLNEPNGSYACSLEICELIESEISSYLRKNVHKTIMFFDMSSLVYEVKDKMDSLFLLSKEEKNKN